MIDDDNISCQLPRTDLASNLSDSAYASALTRQAQLVSRIAKRLSEALNRPPDVLARTMLELDESLDSLKTFLQQFVDFESPVDNCKAGANLSLQQSIHIRMAHYIAVFDLHTTLTYPWSQRILGQAAYEILRDQIQRSMEIVAKTARDAILATQFLRLDATTSIL